MLNTMKRLCVAVALGAGIAAYGIPAHAQAQSVEMVLTNDVAVTHWKTRYMDRYASELETRTNGRIKTKVYHAAQLYTDRDAVAALGTGSVHMAWPMSLQFESLDQRFGIVNLPFMITDEMMMTPGLAPKLAEWLSKYVEDRGIKVLGLMRVAELMVVTRDKPIQAAEDFKGMKVRVTGGRVLQDLFRSYGASPITMPPTEMASAMQQGAIDGTFVSASGWEMVGSAGKYASTVPAMSILTYAVSVDKAWFDGLDAELKTAILTQTEEILSEQWREAIAEDKKTLDKMVGSGGQYSRVDDAGLAEFRKRADAVNARFTDSHADAYKEFRAILASHGF